MFFGKIDLVTLVGHFHPLLVHLPIGVLVFALIISVLPLKQRANMAPALSLSLLISSFSALAACVAGYLLSLSGEYDLVLVERHQWLGIATCILSFTAFYVVRYRRILLWSTVLTMVIASHLGGTITHGEGYFFSLGSNTDESRHAAPNNVQPTTGLSGVLQDSVDAAYAIESTDAEGTNSPTASLVAEAKQVFIYRDEIVPILESKCYGCHSAVKKKGGLRLDTEKFIRAGGKNGSIIARDNPNSSVLFSYLVLPIDDEMHMPPKGKKQLDGADIARIHRWIAAGAPFGATIEQAVSREPVSAGYAAANAVATKAAGYAAANAVASNTAGPEDSGGSIDYAAGLSATTATKLVKPVLPSIPAGDPAAIGILTQQGVIVLPIPETGFGLHVNFINVQSVDRTLLEALNKVAEQVVELKFTNQRLGVEQLQWLAPFRNLSKLQLERTGITDQGMTILGSYTNLETLNLYGNAVTDTGLLALASCTKLKKLYLWKTAATEKGIQALKRTIQGLDVESGSLTLIKPDSLHSK